MKKIVIVSPIPILVQELESLLMNQFYQMSILFRSNMKEEMNLNKGDYLIICIRNWNNKELSHLQQLKRRQVKVVVWFANNQTSLIESYLKEGFDGYLPYELEKDELISAILKLENEFYFIHNELVPILYSEYLSKVRRPPLNHVKDLSINLTKREREILIQMTKGISNDKIAENLHIKVNTAKIHVSNVLRKLQVSNRNAAIVKAIQLNLVGK